jgi:thermostable 8-oxoguanine DNA glycosylase
MASTDHQTVIALRTGEVESLHLPPAASEVIPGVYWGRFDEFFTPAFWVARAWIDGDASPFVDYALGQSLREEVIACLLGGHGMPAELGIAAFHRLRDRALLDRISTGAEIERALTEVLVVNGRHLKYRFPRTKARFVSAAIRKLNEEIPPNGSGLKLRNWLLTFPGIGPKTASWITRNHLQSDEVAILDVHLVRAGILMRLFSPSCSIQKHYFEMEAKLVAFAHAANLKLSRFDSMVWCYMRRLNRMALEAQDGINLSTNRS